MGELRNRIDNCMRILHGLILFCAMTHLLSDNAAFGQGTKADYARAATLNERFQGKVRNAEIRPRWMSDGTAFWYASDTGEGKRIFWRVMTATGKKEPMFDHARLAKSLTGTLKTLVTADALPIEALTFASDRKTIYFLAGGKFWQCHLTDYALSEINPKSATEAKELLLQAHAPGDNAVRSWHNGPPTVLLFVNQSGAEVFLYWVDGDGARHSYGSIKAGESRRMTSYSGHAFLAIGSDQKEIAGFVAEDDFKIAVIPAKHVEAAPTPPSTSSGSTGRAPDGKKTAFLRDRNLYCREEATGKETRLTTDGATENYYEEPLFWSPDSKKLVAFRTIPEQEHKVYMVDSSPADQTQPKLKTIDYLKPGDRIAQSKPHLFSVSEGEEIPVSDALFPTPWERDDIRWAPDSSQFTFLYNQRGHQIVRLISVDATTGKVRTIAEEVSKTFVDYANKIHRDFLDATGEVVWMSERDGWNHLYLIDTKTGQVKNQITRGSWVVHSVDRIDAKTRQIWFRAGGVNPAQDPYYIHYCRVNFDGSGFVDLTPGDGTHQAIFSPDGKYLTDTYSRVDMPPVTELRRASDGKLLTEIERADASALTAAGWTTPERFVARGRDGKTDIYGIILRPSNFDPAKKYPIVEEIYAGPHGQHVPKSFATIQGGQVMAELGFIVVRIDGMGTNWRSKAFHDVCWKNLADAGFPDRILWIKAAAAKYPQMDITRGVGIYGGSAGGQNAMRALLDHNDFYTVAVADCGCHDNQMDKIWWNELWMGWPVDESYKKSSNVTDAHKLQGKLLLIVGELDTNVDPASTMQVANALIKADKDFDLLVIPGANHGAAGTPYGRRRQQDFLVRHLLGVEPRAK